jgi:SAM-dependent methyltransferase
VDYQDRPTFRERYRHRKASGQPGWSDDASYEKARRRIEGILSAYRVPARGRFLELGCGNGLTVFFAAEKGLDAYGVEVLPEAVEWANEIRKERGAEVEFRLESVVHLASFPDGFFDFVHDGACLHCIIGDDRAVCLRNVFRVIKRGGLLSCSASLANEEVRGPIQLAPWASYDPATRRIFHGTAACYQLSSEAGFLAEISSAGFRIDDVQKELKAGPEDPSKIGDIHVLAIKP